MSDELRKLRESIKRSKAVIGAAKVLATAEVEAELETQQTEMEQPTPTEQHPRSE